MPNILKSDLYRLSRSGLLYALMAVSALIALLLTMAIRQDIRIGISVFGNMTAFRGIDDIVRVGIQFYKGLGVIVAILLSVFIGQEYGWGTWQHKWMTNKSRCGIYLSKAVSGVIGSTGIFLAYQMTVLLCGGQIRAKLTAAYAATMLSGFCLYAALGVVICMLSMLIKNNTASVIVCLCYVLFCETMASVMNGIGNVNVVVGHIVAFIGKHSLYGMSVLVSGAVDSPGLALFVVRNVCLILSISTAFGLTVFRRYEL